jgi:hypothetical protein
MVKKVKDVDYFEFRIISTPPDGRSFLKLSWGVNASSSRINSASDSSRVVSLPSGLDGLDEHGSENDGVTRLWRSVRVGNELAECRDATADSSVYFNQIIESACFVNVATGNTKYWVPCVSMAKGIFVCVQPS